MRFLRSFCAPAEDQAGLGGADSSTGGEEGSLLPGCSGCKNSVPQSRSLSPPATHCLFWKATFRPCSPDLAWRFISRNPSPSKAFLRGEAPNTPPPKFTLQGAFQGHDPAQAASDPDRAMGRMGLLVGSSWVRPPHFVGSRSWSGLSTNGLRWSS